MAWMVSVQRRVFAGGSATTAAELKSTCCSVISACVSVEVGCEVTELFAALLELGARCRYHVGHLSCSQFVVSDVRMNRNPHE